MGGSSPHTWGTLYMCLRKQFNSRFIPTHVGNTDNTPQQRAALSVHPHTRGEHWDLNGNVWEWNGSSPHTWGTLGNRRRFSAPRRFIPTHVGNTCCCLQPKTWRTVHPPTRGEHVILCRIVLFFFGSSPHTWGTPIEGLPPRIITRFIPTHVGNTPGQSSRSPGRSVHPHTRGEHFRAPGKECAPLGSSPHTWGTRSDV